jgi:hypothetical protein
LEQMRKLVQDASLSRHHAGIPPPHMMVTELRNQVAPGYTSVPHPFYHSALLPHLQQAYPYKLPFSPFMSRGESSPNMTISPFMNRGESSPNMTISPVMTRGASSPNVTFPCPPNHCLTPTTRTDWQNTC